MKRILSLLIILTTISASLKLHAEDNTYRKIVPLKVTPVDFDNYYFSIYYYNDNKSYNLRGYQLNTLPGTITDFKMNPNGATGAFVATKKEIDKLYIYDLFSKEKLHTFDKDLSNISSLCYSQDSKTIFIADDKGLINVYDTKDYKIQSQLYAKLRNPKMMISSKNNYFLAAVDGTSKKANIINRENNTIRKKFTFNTEIVGIEFSADNKLLAISNLNGKINIYDTRTFTIIKTIDNIGEARDCHFHPDNKFISVVSAPNQMIIINILRDTERHVIDFKQAKIDNTRFLKHFDNNKSYIILKSNSNIIMQEALCITPHLNQILKNKLDAKMDIWLKMRDGENIARYSQRVNDKTRIEQTMLIEQEIATSLAQNTIEKAKVNTGNYNVETNVLDLTIDSIPIFIEIPEEEVKDLKNNANIEFQNTKYSLTEEDLFEIEYTEVVNEKTGKSYLFDNKKARPTEPIQREEKTVSLDLVKQTNIELQKLDSIKEAVMNIAKKDNIISDNTNITVDANVKSTTDANGESIINYNISFSYEVKEDFSAKEDFAAGKYNAAESGAAMSMIKVVAIALKGEFAQYIKAGKKIKIDIIGSADGAPIRGRIPYNGIYGELINEPIYKNGIITNITVTKKSAITQNEQLAFLRAWGVKEQLFQSVPALSNMDVEVNNYILVLKEKGGEFRRTTLKISFIDAI